MIATYSQHYMTLMSFAAWMCHTASSLCSSILHAFSSALHSKEEACSIRDSINQQAEQILTQYGNSILRLAYSYLHNLSDAEEVLQDTLIQFLKATPVFENESHKKSLAIACSRQSGQEPDSI